MTKILNPKFLIPTLLSTALAGLVMYIVFAPATWWKPFYVRIETDETPTPQATAEMSAQAIPPSDPQAASHVTPWQSEHGMMYQLDTKVVNLAEPGGLRYLQASIVLEIRPLDQNYYSLDSEERALVEENLKSEIDQRRPMIDDIVMTILSSKTFNQIATVEGKQALKEELMTAINEALGYQGVINIYFTDFVIQ